MARRRLHGETQKRRQKKVVRTLKLRTSTVRKTQTPASLPFEHSPELDPQDVQFLEAMRELRVQRLHGAGGAPMRQDAIRRAHIVADAESDRLFRSAMAESGVAPLDLAGQPKAAPVPPLGREDEERETLEDSGAAKPALPSMAPIARSQPSPRLSRTEPTRFEEPEDGAQLMEEALRSGIASLNEKFLGAPPLTRRPRPILRGRSQAEPDDELDLHGTTQEQAIHKVQSFLLAARAKRLRHVLIITGRGLNSGAQGPVLRGVVQSWLERNGSPYVRRFSWAPPRLGGDGAIWVDLI